MSLNGFVIICYIKCVGSKSEIKAVMKEQPTVKFEEILAPDSNISKSINMIEPTTKNSLLPVTCSVLLVIANQAVSRRLHDNDFLELGRFNNSSRVQLDLTLFLEKSHGVSRRHAILYFSNKSLYLADIGSTNGTCLNDKPLEVAKPEQVQKGDSIILGTLKIQIRFEIIEHS